MNLKSKAREFVARRRMRKLQAAVNLVNSARHPDGSQLAVMRTKVVAGKQYVSGDDGVLRIVGRKK